MDKAASRIRLPFYNAKRVLLECKRTRFENQLFKRCVVNNSQLYEFNTTNVG